MRKAFIFIALMLCGLLATAQTRVDSLRQHLLTPGDGTVLVAAHRGDWRNAPENSLEAVELSIRMGVDIVEVDVRRTLDGVLVLMHNPSIKATTTGRGLVSLSTYRRLQRKTLRSGCRLKTAAKIPTLEEVLVASQGRVLLNLDKAFGYSDEIIALAEKTGTLDQIILKTDKSAKKIEKALGDYKGKVIVMPKVYLSRKDALERIDEYIKRLDPPVFEIIYRNDDDPAMEQVREKLRGRSRIWINTLWDSLCAGHSDDTSFYEGPDAGYGFLIDTMEAGVLQTDRSALLIEYLQERSRRATPTPKKRSLWMQSLPTSTD